MFFHNFFFNLCIQLFWFRLRDCGPPFEVVKRWKDVRGKVFPHSVFSLTLVLGLKIQRRRRQRERHKTIGLISKNNSSARALYVFVHFFAVLCKTTTRNDQIQGFVENVSTRRRIFHSPSQLERHSYQFSSRILRPRCTSWTNWNNRKVAEVTRSYFFKWRFRCRCRRRILRSLMTDSWRKYTHTRTHKNCLG